jgi:hypothetical protein
MLTSTTENKLIAKAGNPAHKVIHTVHSESIQTRSLFPHVTLQPYTKMYRIKKKSSSIYPLPHNDKAKTGTDTVNGLNAYVNVIFQFLFVINLPTFQKSVLLCCYSVFD